MLLFFKTVYPYKAEMCATIKILAPICLGHRDRSIHNDLYGLGSTLGLNKRGGLLFIFFNSRGENCIK